MIVTFIFIIDKSLSFEEILFAPFWIRIFCAVVRVLRIEIALICIVLDVYLCRTWLLLVPLSRLSLW